MKLIDWTIFPALLFSLALVPAGLVAYGAARWALSYFDLALGDQVGMAVVAGVAFVVAYNQAGEFVVRQWKAERGLS